MNDPLGYGDIVDKISIINIKIFHLEQALSEAKTDNERGKIAIEIRENNRERQAWIRELNEKSKTGFYNKKVSHISR